MTVPILKSKLACQGAIVGITWLAFLLRAVNLSSQSLWRDEVDAIRFSSWPLDQLLRGLFQAGHNGPLYFLLLRPWRAFSGDTEFALRYPSVVMGTLAVPLSFVFARQLGLSHRLSLLLGLLLATSPYLVWYGQEAKMYTLLLALILLGFIAYLKALGGATFPFLNHHNNWWWAIFVAATTLAFYTHILSPLILLIYGLVALAHPHYLRNRWRGWLVSMACLTLPYLPLAWWQLPLLLQGYQSGHPFYPFQEQTFLLLQLYSSGLIQPTIGLTATIIFVFLLLCGLLLNQRTMRLDQLLRPPAVTSKPNKIWNVRLILALWSLLPPLVVYIISLRVQVFEDRYLIYITPAFYLLIVLGLVIVRQYARWLAAAGLSLILAINLLGVWQQQRQPVKADFRAVAAHLSQQSEPASTIMVQTPYLHHTLNYYYHHDYQRLEGLWTNGGKSEAQVDAEMRALTKDLSNIWVVISEEDLWDQRHLTRGWLDENAQLLEEKRYVRVNLYHYQLR